MDLRSVAHEDAIAALRQTPSKVRLAVLRDEAQYRDEENLDVFQVELQKRTGRGLGLSIVGKRWAQPKSVLNKFPQTLHVSAILCTNRPDLVMTSIRLTKLKSCFFAFFLSFYNVQKSVFKINL